jgi:membrane protease YdiL (CAAX protease family)
VRVHLLAAEFLLVFCALPLAASVPELRIPHLPLLLAVAAACTIALARDRTFERTRLWNGAGAARAAADVGRRAFAALVAVVAIAYPLVSAYPQEIVYRAFLLHRYRPIFGDGRLAVAASAIAFAFLHVVYRNWTALLLTLPAGALLAVTYRRTGSLAAATLEHAAYGILVFTFGLGRFFLSP